MIGPRSARSTGQVTSIPRIRSERKTSRWPRPVARGSSAARSDRALEITQYVDLVADDIGQDAARDRKQLRYFGGR